MQRTRSSWRHARILGMSSAFAASLSLRTFARHSVAAVAALVLLPAMGCGEADDATTSASDAKATTSSEAAGSNALNVVIITLDTTRADALGLYGQERATTPSIDRFAATGVVFDEAESAQPSTLPSHSTIMTGRLPFSHGARANAGYVLAEDNETLAEIFQRHGYVTGAEIAAPVIGSATLLNQGFASYRDLDSFDVHRKKITVDEGNGVRQLELVERDGADITRRGVEFLRRNKDQPFFLWLHYFDPHAFYAAPPPFGDRFKADPYYAEIHYTDFNVGRVLTELRRQGLDDKTLVVITADHGESLGEHGELSHAYFVYEATMHVPLIFVAPGSFVGGRRVGTPVSTADIAPTVLELAGLPPLANIQGVSLAGLIRGDEPPPQLNLYGESFEPLAMFGTNVLRFLRRGSWKYVHKLKPELFDISTDPDELTNVIDEHPELVAEMSKDLLEWVRRENVSHEENRVRLDDEAIAQLNALGYGGEGAPDSFDELRDMAELHVPDPSERVDDWLLYSTGWGELRVRRYDEANKTFGSLLSRNPESLPILRGALAAVHDEDEAAQASRKLPLLDRLIDLDPGNPHHLVSRSDLLTALGEDPKEIESALRSALVLEHCNVPARVVLSNMLSAHGRYAEQRDLLNEGIDDCNAEINTRNDLAYLLATAPEDAVRDGRRAVQIAKQVLADSEDERPDFLDTLACAFAEAGNFKQAKVHSQRAIYLMSQREMPEESVAPYLEHLAKFEKGEAVRVGGSAK